jgi:hypothetical protein
MDNKLLAEILAAHADQIAHERGGKEVYLSLFPDDQDKLEPLLGVAERIKPVMRPVTPPPTFRRSLGKILLAEATRQIARRAAHPAANFKGGVLWSVAALGSAISVIGLALVIFIRSYHHHTRPQAASPSP